MDVEKIMPDGFDIAPISLKSLSIKNISDNSEIGKFTKVLINNTDVGVITPDKYRLIANRSQLCVQLARWNFTQIENMTEKYVNSLGDGFLTVYVPYKMFKANALEKALLKVKNSNNFPLERLCLELSSDVLYENSSEVCENMEKIRKEFNVKFMLSEYGGEFCPVLRLSSFHFDYIITDSALFNKKALTSSYLKDAVSIAKANNVHMILACSYKRADLLSIAKEIGFDSYLSNPSDVPDGRLINV